MRTIAALLLFIPGIICALGIKLMRDSVFAEYYPIFLNKGIQFVIGLIFFIGGIAFIGGFVVHRDRKRQKKDTK
ncbi:DUF2627 domain-containing protein [Ornithinibacillus sp. 4-3]|uniref:DUF2627 domain-containing protein n=1 Tax=Ornithinibacillus sp. 4-3 TaxID=3231488 RepID=A0AB39HMM4_9BACI